MAKEYIWDVTIDAEDHRVSCILKGNKYVLHVDDDFLANVYRKSMAPDDLECPVTICGKTCLFIVWDSKPDLVVDGILLSRGLDHQQALAKRNKDFRMVYRVIFWCGVALLAMVAIFALLGLGNAEDHDDLVFYTIAGVCSVIYGYDKTRRLTLPKNGPIISEENDKGANSK